MAQNRRSLILFRYILISAMIIVVCFAIVWNMVRISLVESEYWDMKADSLKTPNVRMRALRGNILSCKDEILASTVPEYSLFIDFRVDGLKKDTFEKYVKPLSVALASKFGEKSAKGYEQSLRRAYAAKVSRYRLHGKRVSYIDYREVEEFPLLNKGRYKSGFFEEHVITRTKPFGKVASRTIGSLADTGGIYGLEQAYNTQLKGVDGLADKEKVRTAYRMATDYVRKADPRNRIFIVHRLDRATSGVLLFAKDEETKRAFQDNWDKLVGRRGYLAVVEGAPPKDSDTIRTLLRENAAHKVYSVRSGGKEAVTHYTTLSRGKKYALLEVDLDTGRKKQIRAHLSELGCPVAGDRDYGAVTDPLGRLCLHAHELVLTDPFSGEERIFRAEAPRGFRALTR